VGDVPLYLLSAPLTMLRICCHIKSFRTASSCGEAMARRRKEERRAGSASRGMRSDEVVAPPVRGPRRALLAMWCLSRATPRGQPWTPAVTLPHGRNGLSVRRMAVLSTFREPSLCRQVHRELMRNAVLDLTPIIPTTACHQRNYIERYSRYKATNWLNMVIASHSHLNR
jgi:hypothetical protein